MEKTVLLLWLNILSLNVCMSYKILVLFPVPGVSHGILGDGYVRLLLDAGHEVTYITSIPSKAQHPKLHQIDVSGDLQPFPSSYGIKSLLNKEVNLKRQGVVISLVRKWSLTTLNSTAVQNLLNDVNQNFDLVIAEWMYSEIYSGLSVVYDCPYIWASSLQPHSRILGLIDETKNPAYIPDVRSAHDPPFTFRQRISEFWTYLEGLVLMDTYFSWIDKSDYENIFGPIVAKRGRSLPPYDNVKYNASMVLANSHASLGLPMSLPESYKAVGGYYITKDLKPLEADLKNIVDNAKNGIIYFSMGSILKSKDLPEELKKNLLKMFGGLKQTVLWKFEEDLENLPKNLHILKWAPQQSILSHKKCVLFITHGGLLSTIETVYYGVPIIGIPMYADQFINVQRSINRGFAKKVDLSYNLDMDLKAVIEEVLANPKYAEKARELSVIYHHRPVSPDKELVHWVEHVIQTRGALHLRSPALMTPWYQKMFLDIISLVVILTCCIVICLKAIFRLSKQYVVKKIKSS